VRIPARRQPDLTQIAPGKYNSLRRYPHLVARLRQHVPAGTASLALRAVLRRDQFEARARVELFAKLADELFREVQFPEDAVQGLSGEQLVRNATDVLFRENGTGRGGRAGADR